MKEHILAFKALGELSKIKVGASFEKAPVKKHVYGDSYVVTVGKHDGFLHKIQMSDTPQPSKGAESEDEFGQPKKKEVVEKVVFPEGHLFESVKIKEVNFFDGMPVLSLKPSVLKGDSLNYSML